MPSDSLTKLRYLLPQKFKTINRKKLLTVFILFLIILSAIIIAFKNAKEVKDDGLITSEDDGYEKLVVPERERPFFELQTEKTRKFGILPQENFVLITQQPVTVEFLESVLTTNEDFSVEQLSDREYRIKNEKLLSLDQPMTIKLNTKGMELGGYTFERDYSWSFQAQGKFRVVNTIPGNEKTKIPLNAGIEIIFSQDDFAAPSSLIEVSPDFEYKTQIVDETFTIIPVENLLPETVYTITLKAGLRLNSRADQIDEDYVFTFQTQERPTPQKEKPFLNILNNFIQTAPTEPFITRVYKNNWNDDTKIKLLFYRFPSADAFISNRMEYDKTSSSWTEYYANKHNFSDGLPQVYQEEVSVQRQNQIDYLQTTKSLDPGYYLVEFVLNDELISDQVWYQSSELTAYVSLGKDDTIVWANDLATQKPAESVLVSSQSTGGTWYTNSEGVAKFPTSQVYFNEESHYLKLTDLVEKSLVLPVPSQKGNQGPDDRSQFDFWSYIYTEKYFYSSNDTINYWGVIKDRDSGTIPNAQLVLDSSGDEILSRDLTISSNGTYIGNIPLEEAPNGWYNLTVKVDDEIVDSVSFTVREYIKPDMKIELSSDKKAIFVDEEVKFNINTAFFDETPGAGIKLNVYESRNSDKKEILTDENGSAEYVYKPTYQETGYYPRYEGISALPALSQDSIIQGYGSVQVFGPRIMLTSIKEQENQKAKLSTTVNRIDLSGINEGTTNDPKGDIVSGQEINVRITENWTERIEDGTFYNFIEKLTYKKYKYERHSEILEEKTLSSNSNGQINYEFDMKLDRSYDVELVTTDELGHKISQKHYFYASRWSNSYINNDEDSNIYLDIAFGRESNEYSLGEDVHLKLTQQGEDFKDNENINYLFTNVQRGRQEINVTDIPSHSFTFSDNSVPNTYVSALVFDGRRYKKTNAVCRRDWICGDYYGYYSYGYNNFTGLQIVYDNEDSKLDIQIKYSQEEFEPGDSAIVQAVVTKDDSPVSGASVNLVMVDASLAAIGGVREPDVRGTLYDAVPHQVYYVYNSHAPIVPDVPQAEKGGGGGDRELFKDTAVFMQSTTDDSGIARFSFDLPDNITTWLTYAQAVNSGLDAGEGESSIIVTKDFFVTSKFPKSILESDETSISVNSFGKALKVGDEIDYTVIYSANDQEIESETARGKAYQEIYFGFPKLTQNIYDVTVRGEINDYNDGIKLPIEIITSRVKQNYSAKHSLFEGEGIQEIIPDDYLEEEPVTLVVSDKGKGIYFDTLRNYCLKSNSNRIESKITAKRSDTLLRDSFDYDICVTDDSMLSDYQNNDGGLAQVTWGGSDLQTTIWAYIVAPDSFNNEGLIKFFDEKFTNNQGSKIQKIQAGWGLSMLGESKLRELKGLMQADLNFEEKLNLALALAYLEDTEISREMFLDLLNDYGYTLSPYIRIDENQDRGSKPEDFVVATSKVLLLGEMVEQKYNEGLYLYVDDHRGNLEHYLIDISEIEYIDKEIASLPDTDTIFDITTVNGTENVTLDRGRSEVYELTSADIDQFDLTLQAGKSDLLVKYVLGINALNTKQLDGRMTINRAYQKINNDGEGINTGDIVEVVLDLQLDRERAPKGGYQVKDILPSGLTFLSNPGSFGLNYNRHYPTELNNIVTFSVYNNPYYFENNREKLVYYARVSAVGKFKAEPAVFQSKKELTVLTKSEEDTVVIE